VQKLQELQTFLRERQEKNNNQETQQTTTQTEDAKASTVL
jgi:hypothetical protein